MRFVHRFTTPKKAQKSESILHYTKQHFLEEKIPSRFKGFFRTLTSILKKPAPYEHAGSLYIESSKKGI
jgi:hypothetical protein